MVSADAHIYRRGKRKVILGPAGHALRARPAGKNLGIQWNHHIYLEIVCIIISIHPVLSSKMAASEKAFDLFNSLANLLSKCRVGNPGKGYRK